MFFGNGFYSSWKLTLPAMTLFSVLTSAQIHSCCLRCHFLYWVWAAILKPEFIRALFSVSALTCLSLRNLGVHIQSHCHISPVPRSCQVHKISKLVHCDFFFPRITLLVHTFILKVYSVRLLSEVCKMQSTIHALKAVQKFSVERWILGGTVVQWGSLWVLPPTVHRHAH